MLLRKAPGYQYTSKLEYRASAILAFTLFMLTISTSRLLGYKLFINGEKNIILLLFFTIYILSFLRFTRETHLKRLIISWNKLRKDERRKWLLKLILLLVFSLGTFILSIRA